MLCPPEVPASGRAELLRSAGRISRNRCAALRAEPLRHLRKELLHCSVKVGHVCRRLNFCSAHHPSPRPYHNGTPPFFTKSSKKGVKKKELFWALLQPVSFRAAPRRLLPDFSSGQAKTHEKVLCFGAFSCALVCPGRALKKSVVPLFHVLWFYTDSLRPPGLKYCENVQERGPRSSFYFTTVK